MKRLISILAAAVCAFTLCPMPIARAVSDSGTCGENLTWTLEDGVLTVSGTGSMLPGTNWQSMQSEITEVVIEEGAENISREAFSNCNRITSVSLPQSLTAIDSFCFRACTALQTINIPESVINIGTGCFTGCIKLTSAVLPDGLEQIPYSLFQNCRALSDVKLPAGCTRIGQSSFSGCTALKSITLPDTLYALDSASFSFSGLESVSLPEAVTVIPDSCFYMCQSLRSVKLSARLKSLGLQCFAGCTALEPDGLQIPDSVTEVSEFFANGCTKWLNGQGDYVIVGAGILYCYQGKDNAAQIPEGVTCTTRLAFSNCTGLFYVFCNPEMQELKNGTFDNCRELEKILIPPSVTVIEPYFAVGCDNLTTIIGEPDSAAERFAAENGYNFENTETDIGETVYPDHEHDTFSFGNSSAYLGKSYRIDPWLEAELLDYAPFPAQEWEKLNSPWTGACYGLSAVTILVKTGIIPLSALDENAACLHDVQPSQRVSDLVHFYQLTQNLPAVFDGSTNANLKTQFERMTKAVQCALNVNHGGEPFIITINTQSGGSHALVGYGLEAGEWEWNGESYNRRILIWDSNYISETEKTAIYLDASTLHWTLPAYGISFSKDAETDIGGLIHVVQGTEIINACPYNGMVPLPGDTDCNNTLTISDAVLLAKQITEADIIPRFTGRENADSDRNGVTDLNDLAALLRALA